MLRVSAFKFGAPSAPMFLPRSLCSISTTACTPSAPYAASPHITGRAISTACAPSASAFAMSLPRRNAPSTSTAPFPATASATAATISIGDGRPVAAP